MRYPQSPRPGRPFPETLIDERTGQEFALDLSEARCPRCGFAMLDQGGLSRIPEIGAWNNSCTAVCSECHRTFALQLVMAPPNSIPHVPPLSTRNT
jgi:DNA-directed RNA polymerase subunit RPC12/RpoP